MRAIKPNTRRRSLWRTVLLAIVAIVIGGAGTVAALADLKVIDPAKLAFWRSKEADPRGLDCHSRLRSADPRLHEVTRDYLMNPKTGEWVIDVHAAESGSERGHHRLSEDSAGA